MFANYKLLLEFLGKYQGTGSCAKGTETLAISTTDFVCVCLSVGLGPSFSKHAFDIQEMVAPMSNKDIGSLLLIVTGKFAVYFVLLNLTSIISFSHDSHFESKEELSMLSELSESWCYCYFQDLKMCF